MTKKTWSCNQSAISRRGHESGPAGARAFCFTRILPVLLSLLLPLSLGACSGCGGGNHGNTTPPTSSPLITPGITPTPARTPSSSPASSPTRPPGTPTARPTTTPGSLPPSPTTHPSTYADVLEVEVTGTEEEYTFAVTLLSHDTGCDHYADWWEVLAEDGTLLYRRILEHSHVDEQPFSRSGGPVPVTSSRKVIVRGHMNASGYGGKVMSGTVGGGFTYDPSIDRSFAQDVEHQEPLPTGCAF